VDTILASLRRLAPAAAEAAGLRGA
jgi:hypothetical protein